MTEKDQKQLDNEIVTEQEHSLDSQTDDQLDENFHDEQDDYKDEELTSTHTEAVQATSSNKSTKVWMIASIVLFAALIYTLIQPPFNKSESIATVNGVSITKDKLFDKMIETGGLPILDTMIIEEVLNQKASEQGITVTSSDVDEEISMFKMEFPTDSEWQAVLAQNNTTEEELRENLLIQLQIRKLLASQTEVTDDEISTFFEENVDAMTIDDKVPTLEEKEKEIRYTLVNQKVSELAPAFIEEAKASADIKNTFAE